MKPGNEWMPADKQLWGTGDLALFLGGSEDSFTGDLVHLIAKADPGNRIRLQEAFPAEVDAYQTWMSLSHNGGAPTVQQMREALS